MQALAAGAVELLRRAGRLGGCGGLGGAVLRPLVRAVGAVCGAIARPMAWHAHGVVALEGARAAGGHRARSFIAAVLAVAILIANEVQRNALTVGTAELVV